MGNLTSNSGWKIISYREAESRCTPHELMRFRKSFDRWTVKTQKKDAKRTIDKTIFIREVLGGVVPQPIAERMFLSFDHTKSGSLTERDFICSMALFLHGTPTEKCEFVFDMFDIKSTGSITVGDMMEIFQTDVILAKDEQRSKHQILTDSFTLADADRDGKLSFPELRNWAEQNKELTSLTRWIWNDTTSMMPSEETLGGRERLRASGGILAENAQLDSREVKDLERIFGELKKKSKSGRVDKSTLALAFPPGMPEFLLDRIFACFDDNLDGAISLEEFICGVSPFCRGEADEKLDFWFKIFDNDRDGRLSRPEMLGMVTSVWKVLALNLSLTQSVAPAGAPISSSHIAPAAASEKAPLDPQTKASMVAMIDNCFQQFGIPKEGSISFDQYKEWAKQNPLANQFLEHIERMSNIYLGMRPSTPAEEWEIVQQLQSQEEQMKEGDQFYVVSSKWYGLWRERVQPRDSGREVQVGPIDNTRLCVKKSTKTLRPNLSKDHDYCLLPKPVWSVLYNWYGGGPVLRRSVVRALNGALSVEMWPLRLIIVLQRSATMSSKPIEIGCSTSLSLEKFGQMIKRKFKIEDKNIQIWSALDSRPILLRDLNQTLEEAEIAHGQKMIIEIQQENSQWPLDVVTESSSSQSQTSPGQVGLFNMGNTCFLNASLQCLASAPALRDYFAQGHHLREINRVNPLGHGGAMAKAFGELMRRIWVGDGRRFIPSAIAPRRLRSEVARVAPHLGDFSQHDATEFLTFLIDGIHEDLNRVIDKVPTPGVDSNGRPDAIVADESWQQMLQRDQSIVVDALTGTTKSTLICDICQFSSVRFDPFRMLSVPLPLDKNRALAVKIHWLDPTRVPVKYGIFIARNATLAHVKQELYPICGVLPEKLIFVEPYGHYFFKFHSDLDPIARVAPRDLLTAYEVVGPNLAGGRRSRNRKSPATNQPSSSSTSSSSPSSSSSSTPSQPPCPFGPSPGNTEQVDEDVVTISVVHRFLEKQEVYLLSPFVSRLFGVPFIISLKPNERTKAKILEKIWEQLSARIKTPAKVYGQFSEFPDAIEEEKSQSSNSPSPSSPSHSKGTSPRGKGKLKSKKPSTSTSDLLAAANVTDAQPISPVSADSSSSDENAGEFDKYTFALDAASPDRMKLVEPNKKKKKKSRVPRAQLVKVAPAEQQPSSTPGAPAPHDRYLQELIANPPFRLILTNNAGSRCEACPWSSFCLGCDLQDNQIRDQQTIAIEWDRVSIRKYYDSDGLRDVYDHPSLAEAYRLETQPIDLEACMNVFTQTEHLTQDEAWRCGRCQDFRPATKKIELWRLPAVLFIQLKRFYFNGHNLSKIPKLVIFPLEGLQTQPYCATTAPEEATYDLYAVLNHFGGLGSGHYLSYVKHPDDAKWRIFDDSRVRDISANDLVTSAAYLLCYVKRGTNMASFIPPHDPNAPPPEYKDFTPDPNHRLCQIQ